MITLALWLLALGDRSSCVAVGGGGGGGGSGGVAARWRSLR